MTLACCADGFLSLPNEVNQGLSGQFNFFLDAMALIFFLGRQLSKFDISSNV